MTANNNFRITELDPNQIKTNLKDFLRNQSEFTDFDFEGSGMNIILDLLAFNTHYLAFYVNMMAAESFMDSAQLRSAMISHAKHIGYIPNSMNAPTAYVNISVTPSISEDQVSTTLTLPRWTKFISQAIDGKNYIFVNTNANTTIKVGNSFYFTNVALKQGVVVTRTFLVDAGNEKREYFIPSANVDINEIYVSVQSSATNTSYTTYSKFNDLTELRSNTTVFFVEENNIANNYYKIFFGDGVLGKRPENDNIVTITYLDTNGEYANKANSFLVVDSIGGYDDNVVITSLSAASGGAPRETIEEIRYRAPKYYSTQNRAVTADDFETILLKNYPNIISVSVWGGEDETPPVYGKVFICLKPRENYFITNYEKEQIIDDIVKNRSVMTVIPEIIDPDYTWLLWKIKVYYDPLRTNLEENQLKTLVRQSAIDYKDTYLQHFNDKFRISKFQNSIESAENSITGVTVSTTLQKRITPIYFSTKTYNIDFAYALEKNSFSTYPAMQVNDGTGTERNCYIEEVPYAYTGIDSIDVTSGGDNYEDAVVTITGDGTGASAIAVIKNYKIDSITIIDRGNDYTQAEAIITSTTGAGASLKVNLQFNNGELRLFYYKSNGEKVFLNNKIGTINYYSGKISIENLKINSLTPNDIYNEDVLTVNVKPQEDDIESIRNNILDVDENDSRSIVINMVVE